MKRAEEIKEEIIKVPQDMLIDILAVLLLEALPFEIIRVQQSRGIAMIAIQVDGKLSRQEKVLQNIQSLLDDYNQFRFSEFENFKWRES